MHDTILVTAAADVDDELVAAMQRLIVQLSSSASVPGIQEPREIVESGLTPEWASDCSHSRVHQMAIHTLADRHLDQRIGGQFQFAIRIRGAVDEQVQVQPLSLSVYIIRPMSGPIVFIGSSREHVTTARALAECLRRSTRVTVWDDAPFALNDSIFDGLLKEADRADYAIFVFDDDDVTRIRGLEVRTVRDNVLFEFGLFVGRMGKRRTFWISARDSQSALQGRPRALRSARRRSGWVRSRAR
jgi:predicted nucleotide-binding protein